MLKRGLAMQAIAFGDVINIKNQMRTKMK